jgi:leucine dehydrogenase
LAALDGPNAALAGRRVAIQGAGKVGCHLAQLVTEAGGQVVIADRREDRADAAARSCGGQRVGADDILSVACDVLAPCALGGVLNDATVPRLGCRVVCGAANNQLAGPAVDEALRSAGIVYIPDFVASAGGIINIAEEFTGYSRARALARTATIEATTTKILARAEAEGLTTNTVALTMARERVEREGGDRRWEPGDPAAWTNGEPLRQLRPTGTVR